MPTILILAFPKEDPMDATQTFELQFKEINLKSGFNFHSLPHREFSFPAEEVNFIETKLSVVEIAGEPRSGWPTTFFDFKSALGAQVLVIELDAARDPKTGLLPYYLDHFKCSNGNMVNLIYHQTSPDFSLPNHPLHPFPAGTRSIAIEFKMPAKQKTQPFKFSIFVRKTETTEIHDADPQVGNDPPKALTWPRV